MTLTSEYQYIGRSNAVLDQNSRYSYYLLLYAKSDGDMYTGRHTVTVKQRLVSTSTNRFYGFSTSGGISINATDAASWEWQNVPAGPWNDSSLTEDGVTYPCWVDLREAYLVVDVGYGVEKNINVAVYWTFLNGSGGYLPQAYVTAAVSADVTLPMIASASQPSLSASSVELGKGLTIYTNRVSSFTHTLEYRFGNSSGVIARDVGDAYTWYPDIELARQLPSTVSGTAVITCTTYADGSSIGAAKQVTVTLTVPESIVPTVSARWEDTSCAYGKVGVLVQNISKLQVYGDCAGDYGSTPGTPTVTLNGKAYGGGIITDSGELSLVVSVTDSRGRTGYAQYPLTVAAYSPPSLTLSASRCLEDGTADEAGDHAKITVSGYVTQVNGSNTAKLEVVWVGGSETTEPAVGDIFWQKIVPADTNNTMAISAVLKDKLVTVPKDMTLSTGYATMDFLAGGKGVSMGKAATREGFDCAMPAYFTGGINGFLESTDYAGCWYRTVDGETEWENPPMIPGVEYRTTARYNGKRVYTQCVDMGRLPNNGANHVGLTNCEVVNCPNFALVDYSFKLLFENYRTINPNKLTGSHTGNIFWGVVNPGNLWMAYVKTDFDASAASAAGQIWYTRD